MRAGATAHGLLLKKSVPPQPNIHWLRARHPTRLWSTAVRKPTRMGLVGNDDELDPARLLPVKIV